MAAKQQQGATLQEEGLWAQCENPNCQKWRLLPPGTQVKDDEPWFCYMNPDVEKNTCSASEVDYDVNQEIVIDARNYEVTSGHVVPKELMQHSQQPVAPKPKGRRGRPSKRSLDGKTAVPVDDDGKRSRMVSFVDDYFGDESDEEVMPGQGKEDVINKQNAQQMTQVLEQLVSGQMNVASEAWVAMSKTAPEMARMAADLADVYSSLNHFSSIADTTSDMDNNHTHQYAQILKEAEMRYRLMGMMAATLGMATVRQSVALKERTKWEIGDDSEFVPFVAENYQHYQPDGGI